MIFGARSGRRPFSNWQVIRYIVAAAVLFILILSFNFNFLLDLQYDQYKNEPSSNKPQGRLEKIESLIKNQEISSEKYGKMQERLEKLERIVEDRLPSVSDQLISDGRMDTLDGRLNKLEMGLKLLQKDRKSYSGVDLQLIAMQYRLNKLEKARQSLPSTEANRSCEVPNDWQYPLCEEKVQWMKDNWHVNYKCFIDQHDVDPNDMCSVMTFLSEIEGWCPVLPNRKKIIQKLNVTPRQAYLKKEWYDLLAMMKQDHWLWMRQRIKRLWPLWSQGLEALLGRGHPVENHWPKKIFLYMGSFANSPSWFRQAFQGAPLGELVQWSDLIASLFILGHQIVICTNKDEVKYHLSFPDTRRCANKRRLNEYDIVFTDYVGHTFLKKSLGPNYSQYRCRFRILDSFGTEAQFNYENINKPTVTKRRASWGGQNLLLQQFMTMFPHSPDNGFLGFVVEAPINETSHVQYSSRPIALVYGKDARFWKWKDKYLSVLQKYLDLHGTVVGSGMSFIPKFITNHRIMNGRDYQAFLKTVKVFIGLGFPYDGPAPLEAIAHGAVFLNAKLNPPHSRENTDFFKEKPTSRKLTSQHPYAEQFIGKPYVYTIDINNLTEVEIAIKEILTTEVQPFIPYEWTAQGMLERVNALISNQNLCEHVKRWPPMEELHVLTSKDDQSCKEACEKQGLLCEPSFFYDINSVESFKRVGIECSSEATLDSLHAPSYSSIDKSCLLQRSSLLFSCVDSSPIYRRLCPCRDFQPQQVALCKKCSYLNSI